MEWGGIGSEVPIYQGKGWDRVRLGGIVCDRVG
jgi:hypothetical protein